MYFPTFQRTAIFRHDFRDCSELRMIFIENYFVLKSNGAPAAKAIVIEKKSEKKHR